MFVPTVLLEERARTFQDALDKLYEDQSAAENVEYFERNCWPTTTPPSGFTRPTRPRGPGHFRDPGIPLQSLRPRPSKGPLHRLRMLAKPKFEE